MRARTLSSPSPPTPQSRKLTRVLFRSFTGSTRVGQIVAQLCGKYLKPVVLELGGKAPAIVCEDADLKHAANAIKFGGLFHSVRLRLFSVPRSFPACCVLTTHPTRARPRCAGPDLHGDADGYRARVGRRRVPQAPHGKLPPRVASTSDGAALRGLFTAASAERVKGAIDDALSKGAKIVAGENKLEGNVIQPCLLRDVTDDMRIYREEMFAPVFSVLTFSDDAKAIHYANDHEYGLSAAVFTSDIDRGLRLADEIESGAVHINGATVHDHGQVPHGGTKSSGYGRFNGAEGVRCVEFSCSRSRGG